MSRKHKYTAKVIKAYVLRGRIRRIEQKSVKSPRLQDFCLGDRPGAEQAAQNVAVTFLPGEMTKEVPRPTSATVYRITTPPFVCAWPQPDQMRNRIESMNAASLTSTLEKMESYGTASGENIVLAMNAFAGSGSYLFTGTDFLLTLIALNDIVVNTKSFTPGCLNVESARASVNELRRIIRAYLGISPPT